MLTHSQRKCYRKSGVKSYMKVAKMLRDVFILVVNVVPSDDHHLNPPNKKTHTITKVLQQRYIKDLQTFCRSSGPSSHKVKFVQNHIWRQSHCHSIIASQKCNHPNHVSRVITSILSVWRCLYKITSVLAISLLVLSIVHNKFAMAYEYDHCLFSVLFIIKLLWPMSMIIACSQYCS
jgi:hypothetical protein